MLSFQRRIIFLDDQLVELRVIPNGEQHAQKITNRIRFDIHIMKVNSSKL